MVRIQRCAVVVGVLLFPAPASAQILDDGHVDYAARMVDGQFRSLIKDGTRGGAAAWREPSSVVFSLGNAARVTIPQGATFLGRPGDPIWILPQVQRAGVLWAGWNTEELSSAQFDGPASWTLDAVQGPGQVTVFQTGAFGEVDTMFASADGLPDTRAVPLGTHAHGNWAFSREGEYRLTFTMSARLRADGTVVQDTQTLPVAVGSAPTPDPTPTPVPTGTPTPGPGSPGQPAGGNSGLPAVKPTLRASSARVSGRTLSVRLRLNVKSRVSATLRRGGRAAAKAKARTVFSGTRTVRMRLNRRPAAGLYTVRVSAGQLTRSLKVRVSAR